SLGASLVGNDGGLLNLSHVQQKCGNLLPNQLGQQIDKPIEIKPIEINRNIKEATESSVDQIKDQLNTRKLEISSVWFPNLIQSQAKDVKDFCSNVCLEPLRMFTFRKTICVTLCLSVILVKLLASGKLKS
ncbi:hypothetical protein Ac2012v2_004411, partial [Leucoagaricus gongylophorus]